MRYKVGPRTQIDSSLWEMYFCNVLKEGTGTIHEKEPATLLRDRPIVQGTRLDKHGGCAQLSPRTMKVL